MDNEAYHQFPNSGRWNQLRPIGKDIDYVSIIKITPNPKKSHTHAVPAVLGLKFKMMLRTRSSAGNIRKVRFRYGRNSVNRSPGRNNLPEGRERVAPKYITGFIEIENMKNEYFARKMASSDYPYDYPRH